MCTSLQQCFDTNLWQCRRSQPRKYLCFILAIAIFIMQTLASVHSMGSRLQLNKILKHSVGKMKWLWALEGLKLRLCPWHHPLTRPQTCEVTLRTGSKLVSEISPPPPPPPPPRLELHYEELCNNSIPWVLSYSPWMGFQHNIQALIWATCNSRNFVQMTERSPWAQLYILQ